MTKEKKRYTKEHIYVKTDMSLNASIAFMIMGLVNLGETLLGGLVEDTRVIEWIVLAAPWAIFIELCAKRIEIHGDRILCRNYLWRKKRFSIYEIDRVGRSEEKANKVLLYNNEGKELASFKLTMDEAKIALCYLESKGIPVEESLQNGIPYEEYYESCCKKAKRIGSRYLIGIADLAATELGRRRVLSLIKQDVPNRKAAKKVAKQVVSCWNLKRAKLEITSVAMEWKINKKYILSVTREKGRAARLKSLRECCREKGIPVREVMHTKEGKSFVLQDDWFCEVKEILTDFSELTAAIGNLRQGKRLCYEVGAGFAKFQDILNEHPEYVGTDDFNTKHVECRIKRALAMKNQLLSREQWEQLCSEVEAACQSVKKVNVPLVDIQALMTDKERVIFTEEFLESGTEYEMGIWTVCNYMGALATHSYMVTRGLLNLSWYDYAKSMIAGYESVRPLTEEEKACIPSLLRLSIALQMSEKNEDEIVRQSLLGLYKFLDSMQ